MHDCPCCGQVVYTDDTTHLCAGCHAHHFGDEPECYPGNTWHCFTGHCDGSGCTYMGECEGLTVEQAWSKYDPTYDDAMSAMVGILNTIPDAD